MTNIIKFLHWWLLGWVLKKIAIESSLQSLTHQNNFKHLTIVLLHLEKATIVFNTVKTNTHAEKYMKRNQKWVYSSFYSFWLQADEYKSVLMKGLSLYSIKTVGRNANGVSCQNSLLRFLRLFQYNGQEYFCYLFLKCLLIILKSEDGGKSFEKVFQWSLPKNNYYQRLDFNFREACYQNYFSIWSNKNGFENYWWKWGLFVWFKIVFVF